MHDAKNCLVERYVPHGMDIFEMFADLSYAGVLAVLVAVNTAPILMPPTCREWDSNPRTPKGKDILIDLESFSVDRASISLQITAIMRRIF